jgi:rhodanese-related sulfurtransferase
MFGLFGTKKYKEMGASDFAHEIQNNKEVVLLDVRSSGEFTSGYIKGAKNVDIRSNDFSAKVEKLDKSKKYLVYCHSGMRSASACSAMANLGFADVVNLRGGIMAWTSNGFPVQ